MFFVFAHTSFASEDQNPQDPAYVELTLEEALTNALKNSFNMQQAKLDVDRAEEVRDASWDNHGYMLSKTWTGTEELFMNLPGMDNNSLFQALSADRAAHIQKKTFEISQDAIGMQVTQAYYDILKKIKHFNRFQIAAAENSPDQVALINIGHVGISNARYNQLHAGTDI